MARAAEEQEGERRPLKEKEEEGGNPGEHFIGGSEELDRTMDKHHLERYGLFVILVLGEGVMGLCIAPEGEVTRGELLWYIIPGFVVVFCTKLMYFDVDSEDLDDHAINQSRAYEGHWNAVHTPMNVGICMVGSGFLMLISSAVGLGDGDPAAARLYTCASMGVVMLSMTIIRILHKAPQRDNLEEFWKKRVLKEGEEEEEEEEEEEAWYLGGMFKPVMVVLALEHKASPTELYFDLIYVAVIGKMGDALRDGYPLLTYILYVGTCWGFWQDTTKYGSLYNNDDLFHKMFYAAMMFAIVLIGMHVEGGPLGDEGVGMAWSFFVTRVVTAFGNLRVALSMKPENAGESKLRLANKERFDQAIREQAGEQLYDGISNCFTGTLYCIAAFSDGDTRKFLFWICWMWMFVDSYSFIWTDYCFGGGDEGEAEDEGEGTEEHEMKQPVNGEMGEGKMLKHMHPEEKQNLTPEEKVRLYEESYRDKFNTIIDRQYKGCMQIWYMQLASQLVVSLIFLWLAYTTPEFLSAFAVIFLMALMMVYLVALNFADEYFNGKISKEQKELIDDREEVMADLKQMLKLNNEAEKEVFELKRQRVSIVGKNDRPGIRWNREEDTQWDGNYQQV